MTICSMTGFGRGESENKNYLVSVEIKTVNHRFRDIRFKMSHHFNPLELKMKKKIETFFSRGSFDIYINYKKAESNTFVDSIDSKKVVSYLKEMKKISDEAGVSFQAQPTSFLRQEFYKDQDDSVQDELTYLVEGAFDLAVKELKLSRTQEGEKLGHVLLKHQDDYKTIFENIDGVAKKYRMGIEKKLRKKIDELSSELKFDEPRYLQEVIYYLEKLDIDEEINRIIIHLEKLNDIIGKGGDVGRNIEFLLQELNRETNTIGSKSGDIEISDSVVQMKVHLEKIREQALNLE